MTENQQMQAPATTTTMDVKNFAAKFSTKGEVYRFLTVEAGVYLPHYPTVSIWHMKDLASGTKKVSFCHFTKHVLGNSL